MQNISFCTHTKIYSLDSIYFSNQLLPLKDNRLFLETRCTYKKLKKYYFKISRRRAESLIIEIISIVIVNHLVI